MKITINYQRNAEIEIIEIYGELTGEGSVELADFLYASLDNGRCYKIINLAHVKKADDLGLNVLEYFINRGLKIRLFNVGLEIQTLLSLSGKSAVIKAYNCWDRDEAILLLEEEITAEKETVNGNVMGRHFNRAEASLSAEIKCCAVHGEETTFKSVVRNISEGGAFMYLNTESVEMLNNPEIAGLGLSSINFRLSEDVEPIEAGGKCVWGVMERGCNYVGVNFMDMKPVHREMISAYVHKRENG